MYSPDNTTLKQWNVCDIFFCKSGSFPNLLEIQQIVNCKDGNEDSNTRM